MTEISQMPRRYFVDNNARRVLIGLTVEETFEFETLDNLSALEEGGDRVTCDENCFPSTMHEKRWLELYSKHDGAWREWLVESCALRSENSAIINQDRVT